MTENFEKHSDEQRKQMLNELLKQGEQQGLDNIKEIMGGNLSDKEAQAIVEKIDNLTQDDASTYELNEMLIRWDEAGEGSAERTELATVIKAKIEGILARGQ